MQPLPQDVEKIVQRGVVIALDAVFFKFLGTAESDLPGAFLSKQYVVIFLLSECLAFLHSQVDPCSVGSHRNIASIDFRHRKPA